GSYPCLFFCHNGSVRRCPTPSERIGQAGMSDQIPLFVDDYYEAIRATVQALGGFKAVGHDLKPDLAVDAAGRWLADCCNVNKRAKLLPSVLVYGPRRARAARVTTLAA